MRFIERVTSRNWAILAGLLIVTAVVRCLLSLVANDIIDVQNYHKVSTAVLDRGIGALYTHTPGLYPYPPIWVWVEVIARWGTDITGVRFGLLTRLPVILADCGTVALLWLWGKDRSALLGAGFGLAYALNPISLMITCLHGQFDGLPVFFSLLSLYLLHKKAAIAYSALSLACAIAFKSYPVLLVAPVVLTLRSVRERLLYLFVSVTPVALLLAPFLLHQPTAVREQLFGYRGAALLGLMVPVRTAYVPIAHRSFPFDLTVSIISVSTVLFLAVYFAIVVLAWRRRTPAVPTAAAIFAAFFCVYAGVAPQYLVWILPFLLLSWSNLSPAFLAYSFTGTLALVGFYMYAVPDTLVVPISSPTISRLAYGIFGTTWWLVVLAITAWLLKEASSVPVRFQTDAPVLRTIFD